MTDGRNWDCASSAACRRPESLPSRVRWPSGCGRSVAGPWASSPTTMCCPPRSLMALAHSLGSAPGGSGRVCRPGSGSVAVGCCGKPPWILTNQCLCESRRLSRAGDEAPLREIDLCLRIPSQWKMFRQELLKHLECFLMAVICGVQMSAPPNSTETVWEDFITCLKKQELIFSAMLEAQPCHLLAKTAVSRPLFLVLDDNFYYQSMRYEVYQLARKYSLGFCQLFLDCPLETCLLRNGHRPQPLPNETIHLMERKIEKPNPEKNSWEHNSLVIQSSACPVEASLEVTDLLYTALENPIKCVEDNTEQKETDRIICSTNILHKADETLRRTISQTMKEAKDEQMPLNNLKLLAEELTKLKADFLEDLRQGNRKYLCFQQTTDLSDVISSFCNERDTVVQKYFSKQH